MSRIGIKPIIIPENVNVDIAKNNHVTIKGPKGELSSNFKTSITIKLDDSKIIVSRKNDDKESKSLHGVGLVVLILAPRS